MYSVKSERAKQNHLQTMQHSKRQQVDKNKIEKLLRANRSRDNRQIGKHL